MFCGLIIRCVNGNALYYVNCNFISRNSNISLEQ